MTAEQLAIVEAFMDPARRSVATHELAAFGGEAIPVLRAILDGALKNRWGVPYERFGEAVSCALVVCGLLGPIAIELEPLVRDRLGPETTGSTTYAATALGRMGARAPETIAALAACLVCDVDLATEAAHTLSAIGALGLPQVVEVTTRSSRAAAIVRRFRAP